MRTVMLIFAFIGFGCSVGVMLLLASLWMEELSEFIHHKKYQCKYKHRFDKPPTAKCYCKDCHYRKLESGSCTSGNINHCMDNWFCSDATPRKTDPDEEK